MRTSIRVPGGQVGVALVVAGPVLTTTWLVAATWTEEPAAFWIGAAILALGAASYLPARRWLKRDHPDAEVDVSAVDLGEGRRPSPAMLA